ncbi:MAG: ATP-binding protein [Thermodesulfobacteriota bacterium]|nr:ATP-binding protein [Thermodesulfobacteriota bacterium]
MIFNHPTAKRLVKLAQAPLAAYQQENYVIRQKAIAVYTLCLMGMGFITALLIQLVFILHQREAVFTIPMIICLVCLPGVVELLRAGRLEWAVSGFLLLTTTLTWSILFLEAFYTTDNPIFVTDTIAFLYSLLALAALISRSKKIFVPIFYLLNIFLLCLFTMYISNTYVVHEDFPLEYLMDNLFAILIIYAVTSSIRSLNDKALAVAEEEAQKNRELSETLERRVQQRTAELEAQTQALQNAQQEIARNAHKAGQADIATAVLHNVGNILNSVVTSSEIIRGRLTGSQIKNIRKANTMLQEHMHAIDDFILHHPKGKKLLEYYLSLDNPLQSENQQLIEEMERLIEKINLIKDVVAAQQAYISSVIFAEPSCLKEIIEDAVTLETDMLNKLNITLHQQYEDLPPVVVPKAKLVHALITIIKNAREAMADNNLDNRQLSIQLQTDKGNAVIRISDTGRGIHPDNLTKIFSHGFTTKKEGRGFGLHGAANEISEMDGSIRAESHGENQGATLIISLPLQQEPAEESGGAL